MLPHTSANHPAPVGAGAAASAAPHRAASGCIGLDRRCIVAFTITQRVHCAYPFIKDQSGIQRQMSDGAVLIDLTEHFIAQSVMNKSRDYSYASFCEK
jgi:hypothetical protein